MNGEYISLETAKRVRRYDILLRRIKILKKEKKELDDYILELEIVINKAIRYIENNLCDNKARIKENISGKDIDGLLEILEGGKNE